MPDVSFDIGGRTYTVACGDGEEKHLKGAAARLATEADHVVKSGQNLPESRVLLMAGLMLADQISEGGETPAAPADDGRIAELEAALAEAHTKTAELKGSLEAAQAELSAVPEAAPVESPAALEKATSALEDLAAKVETAQAS